MSEACERDDAARARAEDGSLGAPERADELQCPDNTPPLAVGSHNRAITDDESVERTRVSMKQRGAESGKRNKPAPVGGATASSSQAQGGTMLSFSKRQPPTAPAHRGDDALHAFSSAHTTNEGTGGGSTPLPAMRESAPRLGPSDYVSVLASSSAAMDEEAETPDHAFPDPSTPRPERRKQTKRRGEELAGARARKKPFPAPAVPKPRLRRAATQRLQQSLPVLPTSEAPHAASSSEDTLLMYRRAATQRLQQSLVSPSAPEAPSAAPSSGEALLMYRRDATQRLQPSLPAPPTSEEAPPAATSSEEALLVYWFDLCQVPFAASSNLFLFGKTEVAPGRFESCCVTVQNTERIVFVLPRPFKLSNANDPESETGEKVEMADVCDRAGITHWMSKPVMRRYCFEKKAEGVPDEAQYLKVVYKASFPALDRNLRGRTFSHVFGTQASPLELFLLKRKLMGPCWLRIEKAAANPRKNSWCALNFVVDSQKKVAVVGKDAPPPPALKVMSLSLRTVVDPKTHAHEIAVASYLLHDNVVVDGPTKNPNQLRSQSVVRPLAWASLPADFSTRASRSQNPVSIQATERGLLGALLDAIHREDPDVIVGHELHSLQSRVLIQRLHALRVPAWSRIGRLNKSQMPRPSSGGFGAGIAGGRLLCDTSVTAKELIRQDTYTLTHLADTQLNMRREEVESAQVPGFFGSSDSLLQLVGLTENDAFLTLSLMFKLEMVPLTRQLTSVCGNLWSRSLQANRANRIEYLLLHEFHNRKFIVPEKYTSKEREQRQAELKRQQLAAAARAQQASRRRRKKNKKPKRDDMDVEEEEEEEEEKEAANVGAVANLDTSGDGGRRKKPGFTGGLVLEPLTGLYDDEFVVLLDFNSLYPSIIREFNLCFTTVRHWDVRDGEPAPLPDRGAPPPNPSAPPPNPSAPPPNLSAPPPNLSAPPPSRGAPPGVLPEVMRRLLERRKAVKRLLKDAKDPEKRKQYDVRQKALKLVANSMYGCLGSGASRFFCKPLAALVTSQGRAILWRSKELAESLSFKVVYGDTDSIMVGTGTMDITQALEIGHQVRKAVNEEYKVLELAIDGVLKSMLLLKKKKYAALMVEEGPDGRLRYRREVKGLDLVRRDWSKLAKDANMYVLDQILAVGKSRDDVVDAIHERLAAVAEAVRANKVALEEFVITKGLVKNVQDYQNPQAHPHVRVAHQMLRQGKGVRAGDFVPYVICEGKGSLAERAFHPDAVRTTGSGLKVDAEWYLRAQVLETVVRLCEPIKETNRQQLAEQLGLDDKKKMNASHLRGEDDVSLLAITFQDDADKYSSCERLKVTCGHCSARFELKGVFDLERGVCGLQCVTPNCKGLVVTGEDVDRLKERVQRACNAHVQEHGAGWCRCSERSCDVRAQEGGGCPAPTCNGTLEPVYSDQALFLQLQYYATLFDVDRASSQLRLVSEPMAALTAEQRRALATLHELASAKVRECAYYRTPLDLWSE